MATSTIVIAGVAAAILVVRPVAGEAPTGTLITSVSIEPGDVDSTVVVVSFDGPITSRRWSHIDGAAPRGVVKIGGIVEAYRPYEVKVGDGRVLRVRIGHHPELDPPEEHLVFDLVDDRVAIVEVSLQDRRLTVVLRRTEASAAPRSPAPIAPRSTAPVPTIAPATPPPTMTPTATTTPTSTPKTTPTATATLPPPTVPPPSAATPSVRTPVEPPPAVPPPQPTTPPRIATPDRGAASTSHLPEGFSGPLLTELVISHRKDGSALVRVTADRPIEGSDLSFYGVRVPPPRNLLVIPYAGLPGEAARLPVHDGLLCEIGVEFPQDGRPPRTEVIFYLASSEVTFERAAVKGVHAVIHLRPPADPRAPLECEVESRTRNRAWRFTATGPPEEASIGNN